jgi:hypothetical protein
MHVRPDGFTAEGKFEIKNLIDQVEKLIVGNATDEELTIRILPPRGISGVHEEISYKRPHITCDNHFSGDNVLDYAGQKDLESRRHCVGIDSPQV